MANEKPVEVNEERIRIRVKDPDDFIKESFRTFDISKKQGIQAVMGKLKSPPEGQAGSMVVQSYLFDKTKWTVERAQAWVEQHRKGLEVSIEEFIKENRTEGHAHVHHSVPVTIDSEKALFARFCMGCGKVLAFEVRSNEKATIQAAQEWLQKNRATVTEALSDGWKKPDKEGDKDMDKETTVINKGNDQDFETMETRDFVGSIKAVNPEKRTIEGLASTDAQDRDGDIIEQDGWDLKRFKKNSPMLWSHQYKEPAIATAEKTWVDKEGLHYVARFPSPGTYPLADIVFNLYKEDILKATSVGFIPKKYQPIQRKPKQPEADGTITVEAGGFFRARRIKEAELLEISFVNVGSNYEALTRSPEYQQLMAKSVGGTMPAVDAELWSKIAEALHEDKAAVPFKHYPLAPEGEAWDGPGEIGKAEVSDLKLMSTWYDSANEEVKSAYKLPHHKADSKNTVFRAVAAAMGALLGARGGVQIPAADKRAVYNHLAKHYKEFDKEAPEFKDFEPETPHLAVAMTVGSKEITEAEVDGMCGKEPAVAPEPKPAVKPAEKQPEGLPAIKQVVEIEVEGMDELQEALDLMKGLKSGRVLSAKTRGQITDAVKQMTEAIASLNALLEATSAADENKPDEPGKEVSDLENLLKQIKELNRA